MRDVPRYVPVRPSGMPPRRVQYPPRKPKWVYVLRRIMVLTLVLIIGLGIVVGIYSFTIYTKTKETIFTVSMEADPNLTVPAAQSVKVKSFAMLLIGLDARPNIGILNTDVLMIAAFNPQTKKATLVSIPRDLVIEMDGYKKHKVNSYYARFRAQAIADGLSKEQANVVAKQEVRTMLSRYFDVEIPYSATINFQGFSDMVDAIGGIDVYVDMDMSYQDQAGSTTIDLKEGQQKLDGDQALDFVRYRKSNNGTGASNDFQRNERQARALSALTDQMKSLSAVTKIADMLDAIGDNLRTDMPAKEVQAFIKTYFGISSSDITTVPIQGEWISPYVYPTLKSISAAKAQLNSTLSGESVDDTTATR